MTRKLVFNIISLALTTFLLIITVYSWYVSNREVTATGISGHTVEPTPIVTSVRIIPFSTRSGNTFTIDTEPEMDETRFKMVYNPSGELDPTYRPSLKLFELNLISTGVNMEQINVQTTVSRFIGYGNSNNYVTQQDLNDGLSMSCVLKYKVLYASNISFVENNTKVTFNNFNTETYDNYTYDKFVFDDNNGNINAQYIKLLKAPQSNITKIYILVDFDETAINRLFSLNVGNTAMDAVLYDEDARLKFNCDFKFMVIGEEVEV